MRREITLRNGSKAVQTIKEGKYKDNATNRKLNRVGKKYTIKLYKFVGKGHKPQRGGILQAVLGAIGSIVPGIMEFINNMIKPKQETTEEREQRIRNLVGYERWRRMSSGRYVLEDPYTHKVYLNPSTGQPFTITQQQYQQLKEIEHANDDPAEFYTV